MKRILLWEPIISQKEREVFAELKYGDTIYEIPYTLMHYLNGWLAIGMHGASSLFAKACSDVSKAFEGIEAEMSKDTFGNREDI